MAHGIRIVSATALVVLLACVLPGPRPTHAEDEAPAPTGAPVVEAMARLLDRPVADYRGSVRIEAPAAAPFAQRIVFVNGGRMGSGSPYEGGFEAHVSAEERAVVSTEALPGFGVYENDERQITRATYETTPPDVDALRRDIIALLDGHGLRRAIENADWVATQGTQGTTWRASLGRRALPTPPPSDIPTPMMPTPKALDVVVAVQLTPAGEVERWEVTVRRSDPMAAFQRRMVEDALAGGGGGGSGVDPFQPSEEDAEEEGSTTVYLLEPIARPGTRMTAFLKSMSELLAAPTTTPR